MRKVRGYAVALITLSLIPAYNRHRNVRSHCYASHIFDRNSLSLPTLCNSLDCYLTFFCTGITRTESVPLYPFLDYKRPANKPIFLSNLDSSFLSVFTVVRETTWGDWGPELDHMFYRCTGEQQWDINVPPFENITGHLIFQSVSSLLQHWPNTRYRNGHTIVPGWVPIGTILYHGRSDPNYPKGAEWTATDPEHSFQFCKRPCWHLTVVTTRPLKVLYFDGSSAVKMHGGSMDSQDILLWGGRKAEMVFSEEERLNQLCKWGREFEMDGFVRMEMNFEVMLCDFESGVETVSFIHLANSSPSDPKPPSTNNEAMSDGVEIETDSEMDVWSGGGLNPAVTIRNFELMHSSSQYNQYPGDTRVKLDLTRLLQ
ncbi:protein [Lentinula edodes]|uniref:Protein n=1 Tax=Lentinula edodes TaxID=5353 RepID=A0A1Q3EA00_LENED|nr:protein [Lentinula edodes]